MTILPQTVVCTLAVSPLLRVDDAMAIGAHTVTLLDLRKSSGQAFVLPQNIDLANFICRIAVVPIHVPFIKGSTPGTRPEQA